MKTLFSALFLAALTFWTVDLKAEIQYKLQNNSGEAYFTVDTPGTVYVDVLATKLDMSSPELMMALTDLGLMGIIENHPGRMVSVVR